VRAGKRQAKIGFDKEMDMAAHLSIRRVTLVLPALVALLACCVGIGSAAAAPLGPIYDIKATWGNTNLPPGGVGQFTVQARNLGDEASSASGDPLQITDELPAGVQVTDIHLMYGGFQLNPSFSECTGIGTGTATCELSESFLEILTQPEPGRV
jgi:hypothetical protein